MIIEVEILVFNFLRKQSAVRSIQWHPNSNKFAVAFKNDVVKVYSSNHPHVILKHPKQKKITCMAWK